MQVTQVNNLPISTTLGYFGLKSQNKIKWAARKNRKNWEKIKRKRNNAPKARLPLGTTTSVSNFLQITSKPATPPSVTTSQVQQRPPLKKAPIITVTEHEVPAIDIRKQFPNLPNNIKTPRDFVLLTMKGKPVGAGSNAIVYMAPRKDSLGEEIVVKIPKALIIAAQKDTSVIPDKLFPVKDSPSMPGHTEHTISHHPFHGSSIGHRDFPHDGIELMRYIKGPVLGIGGKLWGEAKLLNVLGHSRPVLIDPTHNNFAIIAATNIAQATLRLNRAIRATRLLETLIQDADQLKREGRIADIGPGNVILSQEETSFPKMVTLDDPNNSGKLLQKRVKRTPRQSIVIIDTKIRDLEGGNRTWAPEPSVMSIFVSLIESGVSGLLLAPDEIGNFVPKVPERVQKQVYGHLAPFKYQVAPFNTNPKNTRKDLKPSKQASARQTILFELLKAGIGMPSLELDTTANCTGSIYSPYRTPQFALRLCGINPKNWNYIANLFYDTRSQYLSGSTNQQAAENALTKGLKALPYEPDNGDLSTNKY